MEDVLNVKGVQAPVQASHLLDDPIDAFRGSLTRMNTVDPLQLHAAQLAGAQRRFSELRERIPLLTRVADNEQIRRIDTIDDVVPLLFDHAFYKSYPSVLITKKRFTDLTRWLERLTTVDLSKVDASGCKSLDEWLMLLDAESELRVCHSSGTSGSFSLVPWSQAEYETLGAAFAAVFTQNLGVDEDCRTSPGMDVIFPYFRRGGAMVTRLNDVIEKHVAKSPDRFHAAFPGRLSSDVMYLAGQLRNATARGQAHRLEVDADLLCRKAEFDQQAAQMPQLLEDFLARLCDEMAGRKIFSVAVWHTVHSLAKAGLAAGHRHVFDSNSILALGGGAKNMVQPDGWEDEVIEFFGARNIRPGYGMSEVTLAARLCEHGRYHLNPWLVPFVLDPQTTAPLPRRGAQTGRAAFFDLALTTRWGGFITGDRVTVYFEQCPCGQTTPGCDKTITRFGAEHDGEDKITCAATDSAHQETVEFLATT